VNDRLPESLTSTGRPILSVIVPVFNEAATVVQALQAIIDEPTLKEVIIVNDGSTDATAEAVQSWVNLRSSNLNVVHQVAFLQHKSNLGKGRAVRTGLAYARGQYVVIQDADLEVHPSSFPRLLKPLTEGTADFVVGRRNTSAPSWANLNLLGVQILRIVVRILYGYRIHDPACCYKLLSLEDILRFGLNAERFEFCPEVVAKACRMKLRFAEVPVDYFPRSVKDGKKLRLIRDGWTAIQTLVRYIAWNPQSTSGRSDDFHA
jgi:dolichol-phosphate mannosyltransferase